MAEKRIELKAEMMGETVQLTVSDNGQGTLFKIEFS